jgi:acetyl-CoA carboxylase biotin carboxyl carrier protein
VHAGDVAVDIEWPEPGRNGAPPVSTERAMPAPNGRLPVLAAPAVGVFHRCPKPGADPFVQEGDVVRSGQQVAVIESMKVMLPVEAERAGRIVDVLKGDGEPVEYGEPLFALAEGG